MSRHLYGTGPGHPVTGFLDALERALDEVTDAPMWSLDSVETTTVITRLAADLARIAELEARALLHARTLDLPAEIGARSLGAWLSRTTRMTMGEAVRKVRLAETLDRHAPLRTAVAAGEVLPEQATVIGSVVEGLDEAYADRADEVRTHLIDQATAFDAAGLRELGRKIIEVIDPDGAEAAEAKKLEAQEARAREAATLSMSNRGDGTVSGAFTLPEVTAEMLKKALHALAAPKHVRAVEGAGAYDYDKPKAKKLGHAFIEYIENYPTDQLPTMGGLAATIIITVPAPTDTDGGRGARSASDEPRDPQPGRTGGRGARSASDEPRDPDPHPDAGPSQGWRPGTTDAGTRVAPSTLLRWACSAKLMPAVLDTTGHVLDLGRARRFHSPAQRLALIVEQKTCQHPSCDTLGAFCHVHHTHPWEHHGPTNTTDAVLLCPFHHHQAHTHGIDYSLRT